MSYHKILVGLGDMETAPCVIAVANDDGRLIPITLITIKLISFPLGENVIGEN